MIRPGMFRLSVLAGLAVVLAMAAAAWPRPARTVDAVIQTFLHDESIPGAVVAIGHAGQAPEIRAYGLAELEGHKSVNAEHRFRIASLSKPLTAAAILNLVDARKLSLNDRLVDLLPIAAENKDRRYGRIEVRHLLQHTAGWDRETSFEPMVDLTDSVRILEIDEPETCRPIALAMLARTLEFDPGARYAYSNLGYCWLEWIIEAVSGRPYENFVREEILAPVGATGMRIGESGIGAAQLVHYYVAEPNAPKGLASYSASVHALTVLGAAGGWTATVGEYYRFVAPPLKPETSLRPNGLPTHPDYYGLGWRVWPGPEGLTFTHFGAMPGVFSLAIKTHDGIVIVALFNRRPADDWAAFHHLRVALPEVVRAAMSSEPSG